MTERLPNTLAHPRLHRARLHPSRRRVLAAPGFGTAANQRNFPDPLGFARPFAPSSPRPDTRLRAQRIGGFILTPGGGPHPLSVPGHCDRLPPSGERDRLPSTLWLANRRHARVRNGQRTNASCLVFADGHVLGVVIQRKTALLKLLPRVRHTKRRHPFCDWRSMVPAHTGTLLTPASPTKLVSQM